MEENINKKPCVVQKIETPQGFSLSYKDHLLYSKYNPSKNIISLIEKQTLLPGTIILCFSPLLGYGLKELVNKLPENCLIVLCEAEEELYDFTRTQAFIKDFMENNGEIAITCSPSEIKNLPLLLFKLCQQGKYKRVIRLDMSAGVLFNSQLYDRLTAASTDSVMTFWKNRITLTRFGRRYSKNLFENLHYLEQSKAITDFFNEIEKPIIVFGAGESTQTFIDELKKNQGWQTLLSEHYILCVDTALQPLLKNGIRPDGVFVEEAQSIIVKAFTGCPKNIHIFAGLSSIPNLVHIVGADHLSYFFTEYTEGRFFDSLKTKNFMPPANKPFGSVGLTALHYALKFRRDKSIPVYVCGLDFSYSIGSTHTRGALAQLTRLISGNRLQSIANYPAAFGFACDKLTGKNGKTIISTPTLKNYAAMFKSFFADEKNLFDIGKSGIDLGLTQVTDFARQAALFNNSSNELNHHCKADNNLHCKADTNHHCEAKGRSKPQSKEIEEYLQTEKQGLNELRNLLTGKTELRGEALLAKIREIAEAREYLYLHFADGWAFSTEQSFLNRMRTEIDFFLKVL